MTGFGGKVVGARQHLKRAGDVQQLHIGEGKKLDDTRCWRKLWVIWHFRQTVPWQKALVQKQETSVTQYRIGLLAFPAMTQLDLTGPLQVFASLPDAEVRVIWKTLDPIQTHGGLRLVPDTTLANCPKS